MLGFRVYKGARTEVEVFLRRSSYNSVLGSRLATISRSSSVHAFYAPRPKPISKQSSDHPRQDAIGQMIGYLLATLPPG